MRKVASRWVVRMLSPKRHPSSEEDIRVSFPGLSQQQAQSQPLGPFPAAGPDFQKDYMHGVNGRNI